MSFLERCPQFRGVLIEGFHCIQQYGFLCTTVGIASGTYMASQSTVSVSMASQQQLV